jgi:BirA family biotin operon repressor/biotin-[acetyl-CoA-carboxylase] ligase
MDVLHELAQGGAPAGTAVLAEEQTAGRGSRGRRWASPIGGLWLSVLSRPATTGLELVSLRAGLSVAELLDRLGVSGRIMIKWPNDLMLDDRKTGGLLCEARWQGAALAWVVIGLGLNVMNPPDAELEPSATYLGLATPGLQASDLAEPVITTLREVDAGAGVLTPVEQRHFAARDWLRGRALDAPVEGVAAGVAEDGTLLVRREQGAVASVRAGTVVLSTASQSASLT